MTTIALDAEMDRLLRRAARQQGFSRAELIRRHLAIVLESYRPRPKPTVAGMIRGKLGERGDESELFRDRRRRGRSR